MRIADQNVSVIGTGAVGGAMIELFEELGIRLCSAWNSVDGFITDQDGRRTSVNRSYPVNSNETGALIFIAVPDDQIPVVARQLAGLPIFWKDTSVVHCSGALFSDALTPVGNKGAKVASMHPIQTFKRGDGADRFRDIFISLEGDSVLIKGLQQLVRLGGANPITVDKVQKRAVHLAAVMASNYLVTLQYAADEFLADMGVSDGFRLTEPLVKQTLDNISHKGVNNALSGPIERGDLETVKKHLALLQDEPGVLQLYSQLGLKTCELAEQGTSTDSATVARDEMKKLFREVLNNQ